MRLNGEDETMTEKEKLNGKIRLDRKDKTG